jgi:hypothetical protein
MFKKEIKTMQKKRIEFENAKIIFRNFSGRESKFNRDGDRNFCVVIEDEELARKLSDDGWNVKIKPPREEGESALNYIKVKVSYRYKAPKIFMVLPDTNKTVALNEETVGELDYADIITADLVIESSEWNMNGKTGLSAYLRSAYVTIEEDPFSSKYSSYDSSEKPF